MNFVQASILLILAGMGATPILAQEMPVAGGAYLSDEHCEMAQVGELDMIGLEVDANRRAVLIYESACVVAEVQILREGRFYITLDCTEFGDLYELTMFLDIMDSENIRVDGEDLMLCQNGFLADIQASPSANALIELWMDADDGCAGGFGNDPATYAACEDRSNLVQELNDQGWCYGHESQSRSEYDWHICSDGSIF